MAILGTLDPQQFLKDYWQKTPLLIKAATLDYGDALLPDELAGMACEAEVESRLVMQTEQNQWTLEQGPLQESRFADLPQTNWTLLVQAVDQWLPEVADIVKQFDFLPSWRLDDVMVSYAAPGGGVGPHFDYYDVFLLQTRGRRKWKLGQHCDQHSKLVADQPLRLLADFQQTAEFDLEPGDMLYVPAGLAHWGLGLDDQCMTWSIGLRAPSLKELMVNTMVQIADQLPEHLRYRDSLASLQAASGEINTDALVQLSQLRGQLREDLLTEGMADVLGKMSTEVRYPELLERGMPETGTWHLDQVQALFEQAVSLERNTASRLAFRMLADSPNISKLYVNGEMLTSSTQLAKALCAGQTELSLFSSDQDRQLLTELLNAGVYVIEN